MTDTAGGAENLNVNRAICNATGDAERADTDDTTAPSTTSAGPGSTQRPKLMQAIYLEHYVKSLSAINPTLIPRPTFQSYLTALQQNQRPIPSEPLLHIRVTHTAINHVDLLYAHGVHQNNKSGLFKPPFTLGLEFSGVVLAIHNPHSQTQPCKFIPGDKVWGGTLGSHAEEVIVPASACHALPGPGWSLSDVAGLGAGTIPVSYGALTTIAGCKAGDTVLVHAAAGGLGVYAVQIARTLGCRVVGTVGSQAKMRVVEDLLRDPRTGKVGRGEGVVDYSVEGWEKEVLRICREVEKDGVDVVYDTVGLVQKSIRCMTFNGRIVVAGFAGRTGTGAEAVEELEKIAVNRILLKQIKLLGYRFGETGRRLPGETAKMWEGLTEMLGRQPRVVRPVVYRIYEGLDRANEAMEALRLRKVYGKAVIEVCSEEGALREVVEAASMTATNATAKL